MIFRLSNEVPPTVEQYLLPHEKQVITVHKHPAVFAFHCGILAAACTAASLLTSANNSSELLLGASWGACSIIFIWLIIRVAGWFFSFFAVTNARMIFITGLTARKVVTVPLIEITDFRFRRPLLGHLLGYGMFTAEQATYNYRIPKMNFMPYPEQLFLDICEVLLDDEADDSREYEPEGLS